MSSLFFIRIRHINAVHSTILDFKNQAHIDVMFEDCFAKHTLAQFLPLKTDLTILIDEQTQVDSDENLVRTTKRFLHLLILSWYLRFSLFASKNYYSAFFRNKRSLVPNFVTAKMILLSKIYS